MITLTLIICSLSGLFVGGGIVAVYLNRTRKNNQLPAHEEPNSPSLPPSQSSIETVDGGPYRTPDPPDRLAKPDGYQFPTASTHRLLIEPDQLRILETATTKLDYVPKELLIAQLLEFFKNEGIQLFDDEQVKIWLQHQSKRCGQKEAWHWWPFRKKDGEFNVHWDSEQDGGYYRSKWFGDRPFDRLIPLRIIELVLKIEKRFGDSVFFLVSENEIPNQDRFIMVVPKIYTTGTTLNIKFIFGTWKDSESIN